MHTADSECGDLCVVRAAEPSEASVEIELDVADTLEGPKVNDIFEVECEAETNVLSDSDHSESESCSSRANLSSCDVADYWVSWSEPLQTRNPEACGPSMGLLGRVRKLWSLLVPQKRKDVNGHGRTDAETYWETWCEQGLEQGLQPASLEVDTFWNVWAEPAVISDTTGAVRRHRRVKPSEPLDVRVARRVCVLQKAKLERQAAEKAAAATPTTSLAGVTDAHTYWDCWTIDADWPGEQVTQPAADLYWNAWADATPEPEWTELLPTNTEELPPALPSKFEEARIYWAAWEDKVETPTETYWTAWLDEANEATHYWTAW